MKLPRPGFCQFSEGGMPLCPHVRTTVYRHADGHLLCGGCWAGWYGQPHPEAIS